MPSVTIALHRGQRAALATTKRIIALLAGSGGGKTTVGAIWLIREIKRFWNTPVDTQLYLVATPTSDLRHAALAALRPMLRALGDPAYGVEADGWAESEKTWHLKNGAQVVFRSADRPGALEARHYRAAWCDEWGQVTDAAHSAVLRRTAFFNGRVFISTTPYVSAGWTRELVDSARTDPDVFLLQFPSIWNPSYPVSPFMRALRVEPWWRFAMFHLGILTKPEGAALPNFDHATHVIDPFDVGYLVEQRRWDVDAGIDFGGAHPTAIAYGAEGATGLHIWREWVREEVSVYDIARELKAAKPRPRRLFYDPSALQLAIELQRQLSGTGITLIKAVNDQKVGVRTMYGRLQNRTLFFHRGRVPLIIAGVERLRWAPGKEKLVDEMDDESDALRYLVMGRARKGAKMPESAAKPAQRRVAHATAGIMRREF